MKYFFLIFISFLSIQFGFSQNTQLWKGYFSYNTITDISQSDNVFYASSENAVFSKSNITNEIKTTNTIDGLPSQKIASLYFSKTFNKTLIGYENGLMIVVSADGSILKVVDILNKQLPPNIKKINHFNELDGIVYISCDFGIVQYNLSTLQFGDTYFIGTTASEIIVNQTAIFNGYIYAATTAEGLKRAEITNPNLIDANQWTVVAAGNFHHVVSFENNVFAIAASGQIFRSTTGTGFSNFGTTLSPSAVDFRATDDYMIITTPNTVFIYDDQLATPIRFDNFQIPDIFSNFSCATVIGSTMYIGTVAHGVVTVALSNPSSQAFLSPNGPTKNNIFSITVTPGNAIWALYGGYDETLEPEYNGSNSFSKFTQEQGWINKTPADTGNAWDLVRVTVNPSNENQAYISSYYNGLLKIENDELVTIFNKSNTGTTGLETIFPTDPPTDNIRLEQSAFDKSGNLWITNGIVKSPLKVMKAGGGWQSYNMENILSDYFDARFTKLVIDKNGTKWMATRSDGLIGFNESYNNGEFKKIIMGADTGNLPSNAVQAATIDNRNQMWIGTRKGLRVLSSVDRFTSGDDLRANDIIIEENGVGAQLMGELFITDIAVDGANNKWIGTLDAGVFQFSPDGQETLHQFTIDNSPLPSNAINDIDINQTTGEVFFATTGGLVSFKGNAIKASEDLKNVVVYPNPVRPEFFGTVKISGLLDKANVKITDIEGNLVYEAISEGGTLEWDTKAFGKYRVASGVYMIFIAAQDGLETRVKKVMIIR